MPERLSRRAFAVAASAVIVGCTGTPGGSTATAGDDNPAVGGVEQMGGLRLASSAFEGINDFANRGYVGPAPPDDVHTYRFKLYAVDTTLDIPIGASKRRVGTTMQDHRLAQTELTGTYAP